MSKSVVPRMLGDDYQACFFWLLACRLFHEHSKVEKVAYELDDVKSLDDVALFYKTPILDEYSDPVMADYYQIKFHTTQGGTFTWEDLMDPKFINATSYSFLQRLHEVQKEYAPDGKGCRFYLLSPWQIHPDDKLSEIISNKGGELRLDKLFQGGPKSKMGKIREAWKKHLGIKSDEELQKVLRPLRIRSMAGNIEQIINDLLNPSLISTGLKPIKADTITNPYVDLIKGLLIREKKEFTREELENWCKTEGLWIGNSIRDDAAIAIGIRSFYRRAGNMEDETKHMLCLMKHFDERYIKHQSIWNDDILPEVEAFLTRTTREEDFYHLHLDTHSSIAFAAGYFLDSKSGVDVAPIQRFKGRHIWKPDDLGSHTDYPDWVYQDLVLDETAEDVAIAIGARHNIVEDVKTYMQHERLPVKRIINCTVGEGPGAAVIQDGTHAWILADKVATQINNRSIKERKGHLHIFAAAPNALIFFIGQFARAFGSCTLYEYDFDTRIPGAYQPSITLPPQRK